MESTAARPAVVALAALSTIVALNPTVAQQAAHEGGGSRRR